MLQCSARQQKQAFCQGYQEAPIHYKLVKGHHYQRSGPMSFNVSLTFLIALLLLMQHVPAALCRQLASAAAEKRQHQIMSRPNMRFDMGSSAAAIEVPQDKRSDDDMAARLSQPEEIFSAPSSSTAGGGEIDMNYDEYPMIVPKRAALLLDRLMVALHHALEQERGEHRISQFYANDYKDAKTNLKQINTPNTDNDNNNNDDANSANNFQMYSDDDPSVMLDYDFKDLNSINRATGETLMAKSFQRRANTAFASINGGGGGGAVGGAGGDSIATLNGMNMGSSVRIGGVNSGSSGRRIGSGRMYWRCYFNAVSCF